MEVPITTLFAKASEVALPDKNKMRDQIRSARLSLLQEEVLLTQNELAQSQKQPTAASNQPESRVILTPSEPITHRGTLPVGKHRVDCIPA
jgi:hypothetical protein